MRSVTQKTHNQCSTQYDRKGHNLSVNIFICCYMCVYKLPGVLICEDIDITSQLYNRCIKFIHSIVNGQNTISNMCLRLAVCDILWVLYLVVV